METRDVVVLGGGLAGLAAASELGDRAVVLERGDRPGGLVRTEYRNGWWFDRVIHLLYFRDEDTGRRIRALLGDDLAPCRPEAWVECSAGTVRFPFQANLGGLEEDVAFRCVEDFARASFAPPARTPANFHDHLLATFGRSMFDVFFGPYNRKMWKRDLRSLAPGGFTWNIVRPPFAQMLRGLVRPDTETDSYNADGWYPRPPLGSSVRGMEVLSSRLADGVHDLRLGRTVEEVDLERRTVTFRRRGARRVVRWNDACVSTLPLPRLVAMCRQTPAGLKREVHRLTRNRVWTVMISVRGSEPPGRGHWRYYTDESLIFNRLISMNAFDPLCAPDDGFGILAEITEPAERAPRSRAWILRRTLRDVERAGAIPPQCRVVDAELLLVDPAYVVFSLDSQSVVTRAKQFLRRWNVKTIGRYGNWEYSSMSDALAAGFDCGRALRIGRETDVVVEEAAGR